MSRYRDDNTSDSFDLFLDTICNTFGGIVFLAILLAIMIQTRAIVKAPEQQNESPLTADEIRELMVELDEVTAQHAALVQTTESLPPLEKKSADQEFYDLLDKEERTEQGLAASMAAKSQAAKILGEQMANNAELAAENAEVPKTKEIVKSEVEEAIKKYETLVSNRQTTLRLPRTRYSSADTQLVLIQDDHVFAAQRTRMRSTDLNSRQVSSKSSGDGGFIVAPKDGRGDKIMGEGADSLITTARASGITLTIAVWPDSFDKFGEFKEAMVRKQVLYRLWPQKEDQELTVYFGGGGGGVQ